MRRVEEKDFIDINLWRSLRNARIIPPDLYPPIGIIEPDVACGFINFTETKMALMENFASNPKADRSMREKTMMQIIEALELIAYDKGIRWVVGVTNSPRIERYSLDSGATKTHYKVFGKELYGRR